MREDLCSSCPAAVARPSATLIDSLPRPQPAAVSAALPRPSPRPPPPSPPPRCSSSPRFHWRVLRPAHFDLDYYPEEETAVREQARIAERWHARLSALFGAAPRRRTPVIVYANQDDFRQTAPTPEPLGQGSGGILDPVHGRVVLPLSGDGLENERLLAHQLVHVFPFELLRRQRRRQPLAVLLGRP